MLYFFYHILGWCPAWMTADLFSCFASGVLSHRPWMNDTKTKDLLIDFLVQSLLIDTLPSRVSIIQSITLTLRRCFNNDDERGPKPERHFQKCSPPDLTHAKRSTPAARHDSQPFLRAVYGAQ